MFNRNYILYDGNKYKQYNTEEECHKRIKELFEDDSYANDFVIYEAIKEIKILRNIKTHTIDLKNGST